MKIGDDIFLVLFFFQLRFYFNMFGHEIGRLSVYLKTSYQSPPEELWTWTGVQDHQNWRRAEVEITSSQDF